MNITKTPIGSHAAWRQLAAKSIKMRPAGPTDTVATKLARRTRQIYSAITDPEAANLLLQWSPASTALPTDHTALAASAGYPAAARRSQPVTAGKTLAVPPLVRPPPTQLVSSERQYPSRCPTSQPAAAWVLWHFGSAETALFRAVKSQLRRQQTDSGDKC
jgi:hypothetical protein